MKPALLFIPAHVTKYYGKREMLPECHPVFDLEDAVPAPCKDIAYTLLEREGPAWCEQHAVLIRLDTSSLQTIERGLAVGESIGCAGYVLPKISTVTDVDRVLCAGLARVHDERTILTIAVVESFAGLQQVPAILGVHGDLLDACGYGIEDILADCHVPEVDQSLRDQIALQFSLSCQTAGIRAFDTIDLHVADIARFRGGCVLSRSRLFSGKMCIHPQQADVVSQVFRVTADDLAWAQRVIAVHAESKELEYALVDGVLLTPKAVARAQRIVAEAGGVDV